MLRSGWSNSCGFLCGNARSDTAEKAAPGLRQAQSTAEGGAIIVFEQQNTGRVSVGSNTSFHQEQQKEASLLPLLSHSQSCAGEQQVSKVVFGSALVLSSGAAAVLREVCVFCTG